MHYGYLARLRFILHGLTVADIFPFTEKSFLFVPAVVPGPLEVEAFLVSFAFR